MAGIGVNTTSTKSDKVQFLDINWAAGVIMNIGKKERLNYGIRLKYSTFKETFKDLSYYSLDANQNLISEKYKQKNNYSMLSLTSCYQSCYNF
ncbi:MAG: hypothetical protein JKY48_18810 [Flavobacteriales bacterium]|nr:hypothetical protein [Flavobacteriales bacterium]